MTTSRGSRCPSTPTSRRRCVQHHRTRSHQRSLWMSGSRHSHQRPLEPARTTQRVRRRSLTRKPAMVCSSSSTPQKGISMPLSRCHLTTLPARVGIFSSLVTQFYVFRHLRLPLNLRLHLPHRLLCHPSCRLRLCSHLRCLLRRLLSLLRHQCRQRLLSSRLRLALLLPRCLRHRQHHLRASYRPTTTVS